MGDLRGRKAVVLGLGLSNMPVVEYLLARGADVTAADRKTAAELGPRHERLLALGVRLVLGPDYLQSLSGQELAFLTPGMRRDLPELVAARDAGVRFGSEMSLFFAACRAPIIGITGSAGKTTTTTLVGLMLSASRGGVWVGGNIGRPLLPEVGRIGPDDLAVVEMSSFQLQDMVVSPRGAAVLNVTPNHLDVHPSMEHYVDAKRNIHRYQGPGDWAVFNQDNDISRSMARERRERAWATEGSVVTYSRHEPLGVGAFVEGGWLRLRPGAEGAASCLPDGEICRPEEIRLLGEHNIDNVLAAAAVAGLGGATLGAIRAVATSFAGVEHRLEPVRTLAGVRYYNDSIATAPERTIAALRTLPGPIVLILGGSDKRIGFDGLAEEALTCGRVKAVVLMGQTAERIETAIRRAAERLGAEGKPASQPALVRVGGSFASAVEAACEAAAPGDVVLLSPACASFDMFPNFEERGRAFKELVNAMPERSPV
jgi:UDP-N-acetylmuramoylalanine--D-glutamate ligase